MPYLKKLKSIQKNARLYLMSNFLAAIGFSIFFVIFNIYLRKIGISTAHIGMINAAFPWGLAFFIFISGIISDNIGRKKSFILGIWVEASMLLLLILTKNPYLMMGAAFFQGMGSSFFIVSEAPFLTESSSSFERTHLFSFSFSALIIGDFIGSLLSGFLPSILSKSEIIGMKYTLFTGVIILFTSSFFLYQLNENWQKTKKKINFNMFFEPFKALKKDYKKLKIVIIFAATNLMLGAGAGLIIPFFNLYFKDRFQLPISSIGIIFSIGSIITATGTLIAPVVKERFGAIKAIVLMQALSLPFILVLAFTKKTYLAITSYFTRGALMNAAVPINQNTYMELVPEDIRASAVSLTEMSWNISWGIAASISGMLIGRFGYTLPILLMFAFYFSGVLFFYINMRNYKITDEKGS